jgi:hypothetical protein
MNAPALTIQFHDLVAPALLQAQGSCVGAADLDMTLDCSPSFESFPTIGPCDG